MITLTPSSTPQDISMARDILALVSDPVAAKARLDELESMLVRANNGLDAANQLNAEAAAKMAAHDEAAHALAEKTTAFNDYNAARTRQLDELETSLMDRQRRQDAREEEQFAALADRESKAQAREDAVKSRETATAQMESSNKAKQADLDRRLAMVKAAGA